MDLGDAKTTDASARDELRRRLQARTRLLQLQRAPAHCRDQQDKRGGARAEPSAEARAAATAVAATRAFPPEERQATIDRLLAGLKKPDPVVDGDGYGDEVAGPAPPPRVIRAPAAAPLQALDSPQDLLDKFIKSGNDMDTFVASLGMPDPVARVLREAIDKVQHGNKRFSQEEFDAVVVEATKKLLAQAQAP
jgi:hypothetical protein